MYFFVYNNSTLILESTISPYTVTLYAENIKTPFEYTCTEQKCSLEKLAPFTYTMTVKKEGYRDIIETIRLKRKVTETRKIEFVKQVDLIPIESKDIILSDHDKINTIQIKSEKFAFFDLGNRGSFYFEEKNGRLALGHMSIAGKEEKEIAFFDKVSADAITVYPVYGNTSDILISFGDKSVIFQKDTHLVKDIALQVAIRYVKKTDKYYYISTKIGTYLFEIRNGEISYFSLFTDVLFYKDMTIGIVQGGDKERHKNYSLGKESYTYVILFDKNKLNKQVLLETEEKIVKIYEAGEKIIVEDENAQKYTLQGLK